MKRKATRKLAVRSEHLRRIDGAKVAGGLTTEPEPTGEVRSGPCCTKVTVSWCVGGAGA